MKRVPKQFRPKELSEQAPKSPVMHTHAHQHGDGTQHEHPHLHRGDITLHTHQHGGKNG